MAPQPNGKGCLKLSPVFCAVARAPAITTGRRTRFTIIKRAARR